MQRLFYTFFSSFPVYFHSGTTTYHRWIRRGGLHREFLQRQCTMLGLVALNGILGLIVPSDASVRLQDVSLVVLYPAVFLLVCGTFLGACHLPCLFIWLARQTFKAIPQPPLFPRVLRNGLPLRFDHLFRRQLVLGRNARLFLKPYHIYFVLS